MASGALDLLGCSGSAPLRKGEPGRRWEVSAVLRSILTAFVLGAQLVIGGSTQAFGGRVVDALTFQPISGAMATLGDRVARTGENGTFVIQGAGEELGIRAYGYARLSVTIESLRRAEGQIELTPFRPRALYLTSLGWESRQLRDAALAIAERTEINALVIDVKGDRGVVAFARAEHVTGTHARRMPTVASLRDLTDSLRAKGIYSIARIVVFKDNVLAPARPDLAVRTAGGRIWRDREGLAWTDPFLRAVWEYNADIAVLAARGGFDEIQFDYVRFPDAPELVFSQASTEASRVAAISGFLEYARQRLAPYNVFIAADVFGYVCWNLDDTGVGQSLAAMLPYVDYLSPMLYPSTFQFGIPGCRDPVTHPYEVVYRSLERALERTHASPLRFRPWLQAFRDYAFGGRVFGGGEIRTEITAAERAGSNGWMLWNPRNVYSPDGLGTKPSPSRTVAEPARQSEQTERCPSSAVITTARGGGGTPWPRK
jgi:hypothetical protein